MQQIAITQLTPQDLKQLIKEVVQQELSSLTDSLINTEVDPLNSREKNCQRHLRRRPIDPSQVDPAGEN